jgi:hypothetical protein
MGVFNYCQDPDVLPRERKPIPTGQEAAWTRDSVWTGAEVSPPPPDRNLFNSFHPYFCLFLDRPACCLLSVLTTHNTNINALGWTRTRNPSKRLAAGPRLKPLGHWDRRDSIPGPPIPSESLYRLH